MQTALTIVVIFDALAWSLGVLPVLKYAQTHRSLPTVYGHSDAGWANGRVWY